MAADPTSVVKFQVPQGTPTVVRGIVVSTDQDDVQVGDVVVALGYGLKLVTDAANGRPEVCMRVFLIPNEHPTRRPDDKLYAKIVMHTIGQYEIVEVAAFTYVLKVEGLDVATVVLLEDGYRVKAESGTDFPTLKFTPSK